MPFSNLFFVLLFLLFFLLFHLLGLFLFLDRLGDVCVHIQGIAHLLPVGVVSKGKK